MQYTFLDMASYLGGDNAAAANGGEKWAAVLENLIKFPSAFSVPPSQGLNSIEFQQDVQQGFQPSTLHSVWLNALLKIPLNSLLKFN